MQVTLPIVIEWFVISDKTSAKYNFFITFYPRSSSHIIFHTKLYINCRKVLPIELKELELCTVHYMRVIALNVQQLSYWCQQMKSDDKDEQIDLMCILC